MTLHLHLNLKHISDASIATFVSFVTLYIAPYWRLNDAFKMLCDALTFNDSFYDISLFLLW